MSRRKLFVSAALALLAAAGTSAANAADVHWSIGINLPPVGAVVSGPPVYAYPPAPVYGPAPVYYAPPRVVYAPAPRYHYRAPAYYAPPRVVYERWDGPRGRGDWGRRGHGHGHAHGHDHDRDDDRRGGRR